MGTERWNGYRILSCTQEMKGTQDFGLGTGKWNGYRNFSAWVQDMEGF